MDESNIAGIVGKHMSLPALLHPFVNSIDFGCRDEVCGCRD